MTNSNSICVNNAEMNANNIDKAKNNSKLINHYNNDKNKEIDLKKNKRLVTAKNNVFDKVSLPSPRLNKRYRFSILPTNEELNNKIDLEIRILDGILKLLNAICSSNSLITNPNGSQLSSNTSSLNCSSSTSSTTASAASVMINNLEMHSLEDTEKCNSIGAEIAAALISNKMPNEPFQNTNNSSFFPSFTSSCSSGVSSNLPLSLITNLNSNCNTDSVEYNHIMQILTACKCLFVSHRKIAIYLQNLQELEKQNLIKRKNLDFTRAINERNNNDKEEKEIFGNESLASRKLFSDNQNQAKYKPNPLSNLNYNEININSSNNNSIYNCSAEIISFGTCKLMLKDIRIPLSWKWNDHLKAIKNSENVNAKFATFAIVHLGNMIYETQLISNIDPSITEICFSESFIFDDVKPNEFEIIIELYSYELFNTGNNILQSVRKLAKQLSDFAAFKRNGNNTGNQNQQHQQQNLSNQIQPLFYNASSTNSSYSYSMHKFKLIARAFLAPKDISDNIETKILHLINDPNLDLTINGSVGYGYNVQNQNSLSSISNTTTKLPLFDYYSCSLNLLPASTFI